MEDCRYNAQGFLECKNTSTVKSNNVEHFNEDLTYIKCGFQLNASEAAKACPICCIKNGLQYGNEYKNVDKSTSCRCDENKKMQLYSDTELAIRPEIMSQLNGHIWNGGSKLSMNECISMCANDNKCRYMVIDTNGNCWNGDLDPELGVRSYKTDYITGIKKNIT